MQFAEIPDGGSLAVLGLGPVGQLAARIGVHLGYQVYGVDPVPERRAMAARHGVTVLDADGFLSRQVTDQLRDATGGRGPDGVVDAVGMEAHGSPIAGAGHAAVGLLPDVVAGAAMKTAGIDKLAALHTAIDAVRRGGTVSLSGVYGGMADPMPMMTIFDKQISLRAGQCNVRRWVDELMPLVDDPSDPLGLLDLATRQVPLDQGHPRCTRSSRRNRTAASRWCSSHDRQD